MLAHPAERKPSAQCFVASASGKATTRNAAGLVSVLVSCVKTGLWGYVVSGELVAFFSPSFKSRKTVRIVFQLRVVAGIPNNLSIWPR